METVTIPKKEYERLKELEKVDFDLMKQFSNSLDDLRDKIYYYLENDEERERIAYGGYWLVGKRFNMADSVRKLVEMLSG